MIASLDVDAQKGFTPLCPKELPVPEGTDIVDELNAQASLANIRIGSKDAHSPNAIWAVKSVEDAFQPLDYTDADLTWPVHCVPGTQGFELLDGLPKPSAYDFFVWKGVEPDLHPYGACYHDILQHLSTGLIEYLHAQGVEQVIVGGLATDFCVKTTVLQLCAAGFEVIVNLAACRGLSPQGVEQAIISMQESGATMVQHHSQLVDILARDAKV